MECWRCGESCEALEYQKIPFRMTCPKCHASLHACVNCKNYQVGLPNDCRIPNTDPVSDRKESNFCEEFAVKDSKSSSAPPKKVSDVHKSLFKEEGELPSDDDNNPEDRFKSLFR
jgi:hypothetical protein